MSFDDLRAADVTPKKKEVTIKVGDKEYHFTAKEISFLQRLHLSSLQAAGLDPLTQLIVYSIEDEDGKHMTLAQANALADEHANVLFSAAASVNKAEDKKGTDEKN